MLGEGGELLTLFRWDNFSKIAVLDSFGSTKMFFDLFSCINYYNSLYYGINSDLISKLPRVQNCAARLISTKDVSNNTLDDVFMKLRWLKVKIKSIYEIL